jgi:hypothetical protein
MTDLTGPTPSPLGPDPDTDTTATPIATTAVSTAPAATPSSATPRRSSRLAWAAALAVVAVVIAASAAITLVLTGASPTATVLSYVPADSVMYGELRLDLPGDQRQQIGQFLSKFPGFADQAALDTKLDEVLDRLVANGTDAKQTFTKDIKPWFGGELAFSMGPLPTASASGDPAAVAASTRALVLLSVKDEALARSWFTSAMTQAGVSGTPEDYQGTALTVFGDPNLPSAKAAFALIGGKVAVAGDLTSVKAAVDTKGSSALKSDPSFTAALGATHSDHLGYVFIDLRHVLERAMALSKSMGGSSPSMSAAMLALVPDWTAFTLRAQGDALVMDTVLPHKDGTPGPTDNRPNGVAAFAPPSTVALVAGNDYGKTLLDSIALYRQDPSLADAFKSVDQVAGVLGGVDAAVGWMGDTGVVVDQVGDSVEGGLVVVPKDAAAAKKLLTTIRSFATLGGGQQGITVRDEDYAGTTITVVDLGDIGSLVGLASGLGGAGVPGGSPIPGGLPGLPTGRVEIAFAATDAVVAVGSGPDFVKHVLDAGTGASLADDNRFTGLVGRVGNQHLGLTFVDIGAVRALVEGSLKNASSQERTQYETSVKPFLVPFDALIAGTVRDGSLDRGHLIVTVK